MARPHPALIELVAGRALPPVAEQQAASLVASAIEHRVEGLLWDAVRTGGVAVPPALAADLARRDLRTQAGNARLWQALAAVNARLDEIGVSVLAAKGIAAEARWYDRLGQRPCNDVDLVLEPAAVARVRDVVAALEPTHFMLDDLPQLVGSGVLQSIDVTFQGVEIDLHVDLLKIEVPTRQTELLWSRSAQVHGPGGIVASAVDAEISLIHFLVHLNKDRFARLLGYSDVLRILAAEDLDWEFVDSFLTGEGLRTQAYAGLNAVAADLRLRAPRHSRPDAVSGAVWRILWRPQTRLQGHTGVASHAHRQLWIPWLAQGRALEAVHWWIRRRVFPPASLVPVYHPDTHGPYLQRLAVGRVRRVKERRRIKRGLVTDPQIALLAGERFKTFPPKWSHIQVPTSSAGAAIAALALYSPCQRAGYAVRDAAWHAVSTLGPQALPSRPRAWNSPVTPDIWRLLLESWYRELGPFDSFAVLGRPQPERSGFSLLLIDGDRGRAFVRMHKGPGSRFAAEQAALDLCTDAAVSTFWHPTVLGAGDADQWSYLAVSALAPQRHTAVQAPQDAVLDELRQALRDLPRAQDVPDHWQPMHGDFTHWNCRSLVDGTTAVFDWEEAGWGPPGADDVLFRATAAALGRGEAVGGPVEAVDFWIARLEARAGNRLRDQLSLETLRVLERMRMLAQRPSAAAQ